MEVAMPAKGDDDPIAAPMLEPVMQAIRAVVARIAFGDHAGAAEQLLDTVALGPGAWAQLPPEFQQEIAGYAPAYLDEANDPEQLVFDLEAIKAFSRPVLLTAGDQSPPIFGPVVAKLVAALPQAEVATFPGTGHIPHVTHPDAYAEAIKVFVRQNLT
jgi:pimeloyl-ACP methyl ester carboxylesterase